jgi:uncharacterized membrane protein
MNLEKLLEFYESHKGGINGTLAGFIIAVAFLLFGFIKVLFIVLLSGIGYYIGKRIHNDKDYIKKLLDRVLPPGTYR